MIDRHDPPPGYTRAMTPTAQVMVPHTPHLLCDETAAAVIGSGAPYRLCPLDADDPYAYARALRDWWQAHLDLVVVEHDIVPAPGMIAALLACPEPWCGHPYHVGGGHYVYGLGLCKITAAVMEHHPGLATAAMRDHRGHADRVRWPAVNEALWRAMERHGHTMHRHTGAVEHLHYPTGDTDRG